MPRKIVIQWLMHGAATTGKLRLRCACIFPDKTQLFLESCMHLVVSAQFWTHHNENQWDEITLITLIKVLSNYIYVFTKNLWASMWCFEGNWTIDKAWHEIWQLSSQSKHDTIEYSLLDGALFLILGVKEELALWLLTSGRETWWSTGVLLTPPLCWLIFSILNFSSFTK